jgi:hypothetical protein
MSAYDNLTAAVALLVIGLVALTAGLLFATAVLHIAMGVFGLSLVFGLSATIRLTMRSAKSSS